jgi:serine/threonine protein phosphatase 1
MNQVDASPPPKNSPAAARPGFVSKLVKRLRAKRGLPATPAGVRIYAVGDIHGCAGQLDRLMAAILSDRESADSDPYLIFLGDYLDRGPDSKGVVERLLAPKTGFKPLYLLGNHDQVLLDFLENPIVYRTWREFGAQETFMSYGVLPPRFDDEQEFADARNRLARALPASHLDFFRSLQVSAQIGDYFFVHAGARPGVALEQQAREDMLWIREEFLNSSHDFGKMIVHGHTPAEGPVRRRNRIGIDTGTYATGRLTAAVLEGQGLRFLST